jgi:hypothetical protein
METPPIPDFIFERSLGFGECGEVFAAKDARGNPVAIKVFNGLAISRAILKSATSRLAHGGWPDGVMPLVASDFDHRPAYWVTPLVADTKQGGGVVPRSLQHQIDAHPGADTLPAIRAIAAALAAMHRRRVAHANLKPGNIFLDESGGVLLADWAQGNMPGISSIRFTDAVLYQPPEQLRAPDGYLQEEGYPWDVYAFGTLAFRLLTGRFPRCHEIFKGVVPPQGLTRRDDIDAELSKIADNLEVEPAITWPQETTDELEAGVCEWIGKCLALDPAQRPGTMMEVAAGLDRIADDVATRHEHARLLDQRRRAGRREIRAWFAFTAATAAAVALAAMWNGKRSLLETERAIHARTVSQLTGELNDAEANVTTAEDARTAAEADAAAARALITSERETALVRLRAARDIADRLFAWSIEEGHRQLPPLDGRNARLDLLEQSLTDFLADADALTGLDAERATARLQLAEIALAQSDVDVATIRLAALPAEVPPIRMARNFLLLGLLQQAAGDPAARATLQQARTTLESATPDDIRVRHIAAILEIHEAKYLLAEGKDSNAIDRFKAATQALNHLADERPQAAILRSELAAARLATATALDGMGIAEEANTTRMFAAAELRTLLEATPGDTALMLELAGCLITLAENAALEGNGEQASQQSAEASKLLDVVLASQPENPVAITRKAALLGLQAGVLRDEGKSGDAAKLYNEAIQMLTTLHTARPGDGMAIYRLALLKWQNARMTGFDGDHPAEIAMLREASTFLEKSASTPGGPPARQTAISTAYLHGDLGHALEMAKDKPAAIAAFTTARDHWKPLAAANPENEEFTEGLAWCERRLSDLAR